MSWGLATVVGLTALFAAPILASLAVVANFARARAELDDRAETDDALALGGHVVLPVFGEHPLPRGEGASSLHGGDND